MDKIYVCEISIISYFINNSSVTSIIYTAIIEIGADQRKIIPNVYRGEGITMKKIRGSFAIQWLIGYCFFLL